MLKINSVFKKHKKMFSNQIRSGVNKDFLNQNHSKQTQLINQKFSFFFKEQKNLNFVDYFIKEEIKTNFEVNVEEILINILNSIKEENITPQILDSCNNIFFLKNLPNNYNDKFDATLILILKNLTQKDSQFFAQQQTQDLFFKLFNLQLKINLNFEMDKSIQIFKELKFEKSQKEIILNSMFNYLERNLRSISNEEAENLIIIYQQFISLVESLQAKNFFINHIKNYYLMLTSFLVNEKYQSFNYLEKLVDKINAIIEENESIFKNNFETDFFKVLINANYNINEKLFILDNAKIEEISLINLLSMFETLNSFDKNYNDSQVIFKNMNLILNYYGRSFFNIKNKMIISKDFYHQKKEQLKISFNPSLFYFTSIFADKFNDLEFFIDYQKELEKNEHSEKSNFHYLNCLIKNLSQDECQKLQQNMIKNFSLLFSVDREVIGTIINFKTGNKDAENHYLKRFLMKDLMKSVEKKLILSLKFYFKGQNIKMINSQIEEFVQQLDQKTIIKLEFEMQLDKIAFLEKLIELNEIDENSYMHIFGFSKDQYFASKEEKKKYSEYIRGKSVFLLQEKMDKSKILDLCTLVEPFIGQDVLQGKIKTFQEFQVKAKEILDKLKLENSPDFMKHEREMSAEFKKKLFLNEIFGNEESDQINREINFEELDENNEKDENNLEIDNYINESDSETLNKEKNEKKELIERFVDIDINIFPIYTFIETMSHKRIIETNIPTNINRSVKFKNNLINILYKGIFNQYQTNSKLPGIDYNRYLFKDYEACLHSQIAWLFVEHDLTKGKLFSLKVEHYLGKDFEDQKLKKELGKEEFFCSENHGYNVDSKFKFSHNVVKNPFFDNLMDYSDNFNDFYLKSYLKNHKNVVDKSEADSLVNKIVKN